ncbi:hypothetical protein AB0B71_22435 [Micromonospora echinofusca]|uniref:5'-methylthioadenosine/S-adenosylhomocysteine nucleosidase family protein n=1 Tax=Micromonospora echinofusca TaxID=47858 RepID=UPI0033EDA401
MTTEDVRHLSLRACRRAARVVRTAEHGRQAYDTVRPRGTTGVLRLAGPLSVILFVAAREGRLVWHGPGSFALLRPPIVRRDPYWAGGPKLLVLRILERRWETIWLAGPPTLAMAAAVGCALLGSPLLALGVVLLGVAHLTVCLAGLAVAGLRDIVGTFRIRPDDQLAAQALPALRWSMPLCHEEDPDRAAELMAAVSDRLSRLISVRVRGAGPVLGAEVDEVFVTEALLCLMTGVTTSAMRSAIPQQQRVGLPYGISADVVFLEPRDQRPGDRRRAFNTASFLLWYVFGGAAVLLMLAYPVADRERRLCGDRCAGRPDEYGEALRWLGQRLLLTDPPDLRPGAPGATLLGLLVSGMALMTIPVAMVALRQVWAAGHRMQANFDRAQEDVHARTKVLLLVARPDEQKAVLDLARERHGIAPYPERRRPHTVFRLGNLAGTEVMLATAMGGPASEAGVEQVAASVIRQWRPHHLILTGTCLGLRPDEQRLGDTVVCHQARNLIHRAVAEVDGRPTEYPRGGFHDASAALLGAFNAAAYGWPGAGVHFGTFLGSGTLYRSDQAVSDLRARFPDAKAADMESYALAGVAAEHKVDWIAVRGISDWGDTAKGDDHRDEAARNAAELVFHVIGSGLLDPYAAGHH